MVLSITNVTVCGCYLTHIVSNGHGRSDAPFRSALLTFDTKSPKGRLLRSQSLQLKSQSLDESQQRRNTDTCTYCCFCSHIFNTCGVKGSGKRARDDDTNTLT